MFRIENDQIIPPSLYGPVLIDKFGLPRYWATVWSTLTQGDLKLSTQNENLRYIEALYSFADNIKGHGSLDDLIWKVHISEILSILEAFFVSIRNQKSNSNNGSKKWRAGFNFIKNTLSWISKNDVKLQRFIEGEQKLHYLESLYSQLRVAKPNRKIKVRSLPASVVEALFDITDPGSPRNPFRNSKISWKVFVIFTILLQQGLRRGELLLLPVDTIKCAVDRRIGNNRYWINITENPYENGDNRCNAPGIKTANSYRQIPVNERLALIVQTYAENYRGRPPHSYLLNSQKNRPMSTEQITKIFSKLSSSLPNSVIRELRDRTGKESVTAHDLRHTCAAVFLNKLLEFGDSMDVATQKMRVFFGWVEESAMPLRYARSVFEDRLSSVWDKIFDNQVEILRAIPSSGLKL